MDFEKHNIEQAIKDDIPQAERDLVYVGIEHNEKDGDQWFAYSTYKHVPKYFLGRSLGSITVKKIQTFTREIWPKARLSVIGVHLPAQYKIVSDYQGRYFIEIKGERQIFIGASFAQAMQLALSIELSTKDDNDILEIIKRWSPKLHY
jgi:hypothetical protein